MTTSQKQAPLNDEEIAKLYVEASRDMPSQSLDSAILASAHKAVQAKPTLASSKRSWAQRWQLPMGIAATVVLSASLTSVMMHEKPEVMTQPTIISSNNSAAPAQTAAPATAQVQAQSPISASSTTESDHASEASTVSPNATASEAPLGGLLDKAMPQKKIAENKAAPQQASMPKSDSKPVEVAKPFTDEDAEHAPLKAAAPAAPMSQTIEVPEGPQADSETAMATTAPIESKAEADAEVIAGAGAANNGATTEEKVVLARKPSNNSAIAENDENLPENWLKNIEDLRNKGELDAARKSLKAFKLRYPDYVLPKQLIEFGK